MMTTLEAGIVGGAAYTPLPLIVPVIAEPPGVPFTDHFSAVSVVPDTAAAKVCEERNATVAAVGDISTLTGAASTGTLTLLPVMEPGPGCRTANRSTSSCAAIPAATSSVGEMNVV
jgi:hypothetical protein